MRGSVTLAPAEVRDRVFRALAPAHRLAATFGHTGAYDPRLLRYVVQLHPLRLRVCIAQADGRRAHCLFEAEGAQLPGGGADLGTAVEAVAAGIIAQLSESAQAAVVANAGAFEDGGLFVMADPNDEAVILALAGPGGSLADATVIGAIGNAPEVTH